MKINLLIARLTVVAIAAFSVPAYAASVNLVQDGNFSSFTQGTTQLIETNGYGANLTYWSTTSTYSFLLNANQANSSGFDNGYTTSGGLYTGSGTPNQIALYNSTAITASPAGGTFIAQDADFQTGTLSQTITGLVVGNSYALSFYQALTQQYGYFGSPTNQWVASLGGSTAYNPQLTAVSGQFTGWSYVTDYFIATSTTETLGFSTNGTGAPPIALLDGVSLVSVPEPASWTVLIWGLVGILGARRWALSRR